MYFLLEEKKKTFNIKSNDKFIHDVLTDEQIINTLDWYEKHKLHIKNLITCLDKFPPTLNEDKRDCRIWKPEYWKWFVEQIPNINNVEYFKYRDKFIEFAKFAKNKTRIRNSL